MPIDARGTLIGDLVQFQLLAEPQISTVEGYLPAGTSLLRIHTAYQGLKYTILFLFIISFPAFCTFTTLDLCFLLAFKIPLKNFQ